LIFDLKL